MAALDDYAKQLAGLKQTYSTATDKTIRDKAAADGTTLRKQAIGAGVDLNQLEDAANKFGNIKPVGTGAQQSAYRQQNIGSAITSAASDKASKLGNFSVGSAGEMKYSNDYLEAANKYQTQLDKMMTNGFTYDYTTDNAYNALKQQVEAGAKQANNQSEAELNSRGILKSSLTDTTIRNTNQSAQNALTQAIPGLEANAYSKWHQGFQDLYNMWNSESDKGFQERTFTYDQADKNAARDGTYEDPQATALMQGIIDLKNQWAGATADQRKVIESSANELRSRLGQLGGYDPNLFGANVSSAQATKNMSSAGIKTLDAQHYDSEWNYKVGQDKIHNKIEQQNADTSRINANKSGNGSGSGGLTPYQLANQQQEQALSGWRALLMQNSKDEASGRAFIVSHSAEMLADHVDPSALFGTNSELYKKSADGTTTTKEPDYSGLMNNAIGYAMKDPSWPGNTPLNLPKEIKMSEAEKNALMQKIVQKYYDQLLGANGGVAANQNPSSSASYGAFVANKLDKLSK